MKNLFLLLGITLLLCVAANAQEKTVGVTGKGVKLGFDAARIHTAYQELNDILDSRIGFIGGAFLTYDLNRQFALQPEILYVSKGSEKSLFIFTAYWDIDYLEIPVLLKFDLDPEGSIHPLLFAGPALDILLNSEIGALGESIDVSDGMKSIDFSIALGGGVDYKHFVFDVRYTLGLANTIDAAKVNRITGFQPGDDFYLEGDPEVKNRNLSFMFGVKFY